MSASPPPLVVCPNCESQVPAGEYCGQCGAHLRTADPARRHAFAAMPNERVVNFNPVSTLFPHLPHRRGGPFRWALIAGVLLVIVMAALHLFAPATVAAAVLLPALYLLYLYEVEVYADEPWLLIGATMVAGAVLGFAFTQIAGSAASGLTVTGDAGGAFALDALAIPIVAQVLMLVGPLVLFAVRERYREPLDGLTFGAASALGFSLATELTALWPVLGGPLVASGDSWDWALRLLRMGVLFALVNAGTTGVVAAALWLQRFDPKRSKKVWEAGVLATATVAFAAQVGLAIVTYLVPQLGVQLVIWALAAIALMLYMRQVIHQALLAEGSALAIGPESTCPECHHIVPLMRFCPNCGAARAAAPRSTRLGARV
jgi:ribosomal protein L32